MKRILFAVALIVFLAACGHKPTPEEIAKQKVIDAQKRVDSILNSHIAIDYSYIDGWGARIKDTSLGNIERSIAMDKLRKYYYDYLVYMGFPLYPNVDYTKHKYKISIDAGYPGVDSLLQMEKEYINQQWHQNTNNMLYRQSLMLSQEGR